MKTDGFINSMHLNRWINKIEDSASMKIMYIFVLFVLVDFIYIYLIGNMFDTQVREIQGSSIEFNYKFLIGCFGVYNLLALAMYYFIILSNKGLVYAFLLGFIIYGDSVDRYVLGWNIIFNCVSTLTTSLGKC